jgi:hypothetical protein
MNPVDPQFVKSLMENIYGNDENLVKHQSCEEAEKSVEKHADTMNNFGIPKNIGNEWKAPKNIPPKKQQLEDHAEEEKSLTESVDPMEERITNLEEGLVNILESLKSLVTNINEEGPSSEELDAIEAEGKSPKKKAKKKGSTSHLNKDNKNAQDTAVGAEGEAAKSGDKVPVGKRGEGQTADLDHVLKNIKPGSEKARELKMKARGHKQTLAHGEPGNQKMSKKEINDLANS